MLKFFPFFERRKYSRGTNTLGSLFMFPPPKHSVNYTRMTKESIFLKAVFFYKAACKSQNSSTSSKSNFPFIEARFDIK